MASLKRILSRLDHERRADHIDNRVWMALKTFELKSNTVENHPELVVVITGFVQHLYISCIGGPEMPPEMGLGRGLELLGVSTLRPLYDTCIRGVGGGVFGVLQKMCEAMIRDLEHKYVAHVMETEMDNPQDYSEIYDLMVEYYRSFAVYIKPFLNVQNVEDLVLNWREILLNHSRILSSIKKDIGQY